MLRRLLAVFLVAVVPLLFLAPASLTPASAQSVVLENGGPDYEAWERDATRAASVLDANRASVDGLQTLREQLVSWRELFLRRQNQRQDVVETVRSQLEALGPAPEDGQTESAEIATRRSELNEELADLTAPIRRAEEAYTRADGLVSRLDSIVRDRQTNKILELNPTPLNPALWPEALTAISEVWGRVATEVRDNSRSPLQSQALRDNLPLIIIMGVLGLALAIRGGAWVERGLARLRDSRHASKARVRVGVFIVSLATLLLPLFGMLLIIGAANQSEMFGVAGTEILGIATGAVLMMYTARWLGRQIAPPAYPPHPLLTLSEGQSVQLRVLANVGGILLAADLALALLLEARLISETALSVLGLPVIVLGGLFLYRLGQLMVQSAKADAQALADAHAENASGAGADGSPFDGPGGLILRYLGRAAHVVAVVGPLLAAIGYTFAGNAIVFSTYLSLGLIAVIAILQRLVKDLYATLRGDEASSDGLIPVLIGFALAVAALPLFALIWGAQVSDISEAWNVISDGVPLGETRISPVDFLKFAVVFALGYGLTRLFQGTLRGQVLPRTNLDTGGRNAIVAGTGYVGIFLAAVIAIASAGIDLSSIAIVAGALSVGIGFGLQTIVSNFVSGIILLIERPISEGDWIEVGGTMGVVKKISVRATQVETFDRRDVIVPNADLISTSVTNWTKGNLSGRIIVPVGVAYGTDTRKVEAILREIAEAQPLVILNPPPAVLFRGFGADSLDFEIRAVLRDVNYAIAVPSDINHAIAERFAAEGIEIPFAQRDVWLRNPEVLQTHAAPAPEAGVPGAEVPEADATGPQQPDGGDADAAKP